MKNLNESIWRKFYIKEGGNMSRITNSMLMNNFMRNLNNNLKNMGRAQEQLASGKKIARPSHDPASAALSLRLRSDLHELEQYAKNAEDGISWMDLTDTALGNASEIISNIQELLVYGASGTNPFQARKAIYDEIEQLEQQLVHIANTTYNGRHIFSGTATRTKSVVEDSPPSFIVVGEDGNNYSIQKYTLNSDSNEKDINFEIGVGNLLSVNIHGQKAFAEIFDTIAQIKEKLLTGESADISSLIDKVGVDNDTVLQYRSQTGAKINRMELTYNRIKDDSVNYTILLSKTEDADLAEVIMNLSTQESVYRASLATGARIIQPTLLDFLR